MGVQLRAAMAAWRGLCGQGTAKAGGGAGAFWCISFFGRVSERQVEYSPMVVADGVCAPRARRGRFSPVARSRFVYTLPAAPLPRLQGR